MAAFKLPAINGLIRYCKPLMQMSHLIYMQCMHAHHGHLLQVHIACLLVQVQSWCALVLNDDAEMQ